MNNDGQSDTSPEQGIKERSEAPPGDPPRHVRLSVNLNSEAAAALRQLADKNKVSITETVRRAVAIYDFIQKEIDTGGKVQVVSRTGDVREMWLL